MRPSAGHPLSTLETYNAKRDFSRTPEPEGKAGKRGGDPRFVVQKHAARRLHYDFRLEVDGVLKSWAVTRGPSLNPDDRRLAVRTEDHPLDYAGFEGVIPRGEYGGGTVMLWDQGTWAPCGDGARSPGQAIEDGKLHFILHGQRMRGEWVLVRMNNAGRGENWLLRKIEDDAADRRHDITQRHATSVATGRGLAEIGKGRRKPSARMGAATASVKDDRAALPGFRPVQLATLARDAPDGDHWLHELKYDGYRAVVACNRSACRIYTRSGRDWTARYRGLADALGERGFDRALFDGEVVALDERGVADFSLLQRALDDRSVLLTLFLFDIRTLAGRELGRLPLGERKEILRALMGQQDPVIRYSDHVTGNGAKLWAAACRNGVEGILSKRVDAPYRPGRSSAWRKVKCEARQEFVVIGFTPSRAPGRAFSSLLLGVHDDDGTLRYVGKVGTGFAARDFASLSAQLAPLARERAAVPVPAAAGARARWVEPAIVVEVRYAELTAGGCLRHARYVGQRGDKPAAAVVLEKAMPEPAIEISSPDRVVFPDSGITKAMVASGYQALAPFMLPFLAGRPVSLLRCPDGLAQKCFFQKHAPRGFGDHIRQVEITESDGDRAMYFHLDDMTGILQCVQMGALEFHGWGARADALETPDRMVFDLDPDTGLAWSAVVDAAVTIRDQLTAMGLASFAMLSGGKGVHVVVPLAPRAQWPEVKDFARRFAHALAASAPERFVAQASKAKRRRRIFIDWLRNERGATSVQPYSLRAREGAPVATPVSWNALRTASSASDFSFERIDELIEQARRMKRARWGMADQALPDL